MQGFFNIHKSIKVIHHINKLKNKNHMIISIDAEEAFDKIQHPYMIKNPPESRHRRNIPQHNESCIWQTHSKHPQWWKIESISPKVRNKAKVPLSSLLFNIVLEVLATAVREEKEIKGIQNRKKEVKLSLFADDMILYVLLLLLLSRFSRVRLCVTP